MNLFPPVQAHDNIARTAAAERDIFIVFPPFCSALQADGQTKKDGAHTMTDQELRRLSRADLIDIIYTLQQQKEQAEQQLAQAQAQLQDRQLRIANAGSIAEAALSLNGVFDAAQAAADQYLQAVRTSAAETQAQKEQILADAERQAKEIVDTAERQAAEHWKRFQLQAGQLIQAHAELQEMFKGMANR